MFCLIIRGQPFDFRVWMGGWGRGVGRFCSFVENNIFGIHVGDKTNMLNLLYIPITTDKMI